MKKHLLVLFFILLLSGCGTMPKDRALSGAGIGAAAGTALGAVTGLTLVEGAALGAAGGALVGAVTDRDDINLGDPAWKQGSTRTTDPNKSNVVAAVQHELTRRGYDVGTADGVMGPRTREAIKSYQQDNGLLVDGRATEELAAYMQRN